MSLSKKKSQLDRLVARYEQPWFIDSDPISIPHGFEDPEDQEIIGLFSALLAWGRRSTTLAKMEQLCERMEGRPAAFIRSFSDRDISNLEGFKHRTFQTQDAIALSMALREALEEFGSMERLFASTDCQSTENIGPAIERAMGYLLAVEGVPARMRKHLPRPSTGSACKRVCLYLRWMVRQGPVDLGIWKTFDPTWLVLPLDVHSARQARHFGMLERAQTDWKAALELTEKCRQLDPRDPCRYDYAFFGVGVSGNGSTNVSA